MAYLIFQYSKKAASGGDYRPLLLQVPAALLMLAYPVQELVTTEIKRGGLYPKEVMATPLREKLQFRGGLLMPAVNALGVCLTIAASVISAGLHDKLQTALRAEAHRADEKASHV